MRVCAAVCLVVMCAPSSFAQAVDPRAAVEALSGTLSVASTPMISGGQVTACTLVFEHFQRDDLYLGGNFIKVSGSVGLMAGDGRIGFVMKAIANEFDPVTMSSNRVDLSRVYLIGRDYVTNYGTLITSFPAEVSGGIFSAFSLDPSITMLLEALAAGEISIAIGPTFGASDIQLKLDTTVISTDEEGVRTRDSAEMLDFYSCSEHLLESALQ